MKKKKKKIKKIEKIKEKRECRALVTEMESHQKVLV